MRKTLSRYCIAAAAFLAAVTSTPTVNAQSAGNDAADSAGLDVIIVTARKRDENIQDVPLAITAFDAVALERNNIVELEDVARLTAGFAFEDFDGGNANPVIRGQATLRATAREQTVATFLDGVYMPRSWLVDIGTSNMERIEIVKGPQSARYGRNAFAGAINYVSRKPGDEFDADIDFTAGNHERFEFNGGISIPVVEDLFSVRAAYSHTEFDGSWENDHPNAGAGISPGTEDNAGGDEVDNFSLHAALTPTDDLAIDLSYYYFDISEEARAARWLNTASGVGNCGSLQGNGGLSLFCGEYPVTGDTITVEPRGFGRQSETDIIRGSVSYGISDTMTISYLGALIDAETLTANTAEADTIGCGTILGPPTFPALCNFQGAPAGSVEYNQHEVRLNFDSDGPWSGALGVFILEGEDRSFSVSINAPPGDTTPFNIRNESFGGFLNFVFRNELTDVNVQAIFGEYSYAFANDRTRVSVEARYTEETIRTFDLRGGGIVGDEEFDFFTPRLTLEHDFGDASLGYATVARGAKAGGFNPNAISPQFATFDPEFNWTYELGSKNTLLDNRMILNGAVYLTKWSDQQVNRLDPLGSPFTGAISANLGDATIWGIEVESLYRATDNLSIDFTLAYVDATYDSGTIDEIFSAGVPAFGFPPPCDDIACSSTGDIGGNDLERSPDLQLSLGAQWEGDISDTTSLFARLDGSWQSSFYADQINAAEAPSRFLANTRIGVDYKNYRVSLWARNLFDEKYVANSLQIIQPFSNNILGTYFGERRTFGLTLSAGFQ
ncbi:MAG: TonB-dependent receptor [Pseudomonadota bacterium]